jgi:hypothetical protein
MAATNDKLLVTDWLSISETRVVSNEEKSSAAGFVDYFKWRDRLAGGCNYVQ